MLISFFFIGIGLSFFIGWFDNSFNHLTEFFFHKTNVPVETRLLGETPSLDVQMASQIMDISGQVQSLMEVRGEVTLLSFWASWCGPCQVELPTLATLYNKLKSQGLHIVAINVDESHVSFRTLVNFWNKMNLPFAFFSDFQGEAVKNFNVHSLPTHFILNQQGQITITAHGANDWSHPRNIQMIQDLLPPGDI